MVIHQFNRLIRNKWVWGVFAIAISVFFAFDFLFTSDGGPEQGSDSVGTLGGKDVPAARFQEVKNEILGLGRRRENTMPDQEANKRTWERLAALAVAEEAGLGASDGEVSDALLRMPGFQKDGGFDAETYSRTLASLQISTKQFESALRDDLTLGKLRAVVQGGSAWASPMEVNNSFYDWTDKFTVRIVTFVDKKADSVKLDDAGLEAYYKEHTNSIALPDCMTVRYIKFPADAPARLSKFTISEDEAHNHYDALLQTKRFETTGTNGVAVTKPFEEVRPILEKELQLLASLEACEKEVGDRVYSADPAAETATNMMQKIATEEKLEIKTTPRFSAEGDKFVEGFMTRPQAILPDCAEFLEKAAALDPESPGYRYEVVRGTNAVYLIERASFAKAHVPTFAEAKEIIRPKALADARAKSFKAQVDKQRALAAAELAKGKPFDAKLFIDANVSTSLTFVASRQDSTFPNARIAIPQAIKLQKGQISEFIPSPMLAGHGLLVYVENRTPGDNDITQDWVRMQLRSELQRSSAGKRWEDWCAWNLSRLGFTTGAGTSVDAPSDEDLLEEN